MIVLTGSFCARLSRSLTRRLRLITIHIGKVADVARDDDDPTTWFIRIRDCSQLHALGKAQIAQGSDGRCADIPTGRRGQD